MSYLYSKLPETGVSPHIGTGGAAMHEAKKGFRRLKAFKQLPALRAALAAHYEKETNSQAVAQNAKAA